MANFIRVHELTTKIENVLNVAKIVRLKPTEDSFGNPKCLIIFQDDGLTVDETFEDVIKKIEDAASIDIL
ncbi:hypothetical protein [Larkinella sp. C7]|uniref:hypothetical protein n=1 Tax=Larkinella sp. C7 TaxID=2576607 RepID=UPI00111127A8|nr:hypothetical protein [Larkinella sp. C7]